jgi:pimeloyl-ACP methyl ester carboxylesterase
MGDEMKIDLLEPVRLGDSAQWIRIRSAKAGNPVLLLIQQGPGLPMINEVRAFQRMLSLESDFTVVYWDQRRCGLSLREPAGTSEVTLGLMAQDTAELLARLSHRYGYGGPVIVTGFSMGGAVGTLAAAARPDLVSALVAVGMDVDGPAAEADAYNFALAAAREQNNRRAIRQLRSIGPPPHVSSRQFTARVRWASNFGGVKRGATYNSMARNLLTSLLRSPDYRLGDAARTIRGIAASQSALLPELAALDLTRLVSRLESPVVMVQGRHDQVAPAAAIERYAGLLDAPSKQLVWFEHSAHMPHLEEPGKFRDLLIQLRGSLPAASSLPAQA